MQPVHFVGSQVRGGPASFEAVAHAPALHAPPMFVQSMHVPPPVPQVATD